MDDLNERGEDEALQPSDIKGIEESSEAERAEYHRKRKMSYSIRLLCALYLSYLVYNLFTGLAELQGTEKAVVTGFMILFTGFDIWCYISGIKGLKRLSDEEKRGL